MADDARWVTVARADDVPPGTARTCWVGDQAVALVNVDGTLCAVEGTCPHRGGPLGDGRLVGEDLACPWHGFRFDPRSGRATMPMGYAALSPLGVRVVEGDVQVAWPPGDQQSAAATG